MILKSQSAMEYLMTYGWTILIIGVVMASLFSIGVFNIGITSTPSVCVAIPGYSCTQPVLSATGALSLSIGQLGQSPITITGLACTATSTAPTSFSSASVTLSSGQTTTLTTVCPITSNSIGTQFNGKIWLQYKNSYSQTVVMPIGSVRLSASNVGGGLVYFTTNGITSSGSSVQITTSTAGNPNLWLCGTAQGSPEPAGFSANYVLDSYSSDGGTVSAAIGHMSSNAGCTASDSGEWGAVDVGINSPVSYTLQQKATTTGVISNTLTVSVPQPSFVVIIVACGGGGQFGMQSNGCDAASGGSISISPAGCSLYKTEDPDNSESASLYICNSISGTYTIIASDNSIHDVDIALAAYIFPNAGAGGSGS